jgi:hypothetical protein
MNRARSIVVAVDRRTRFSVFKLLSIVVLAVLAISFEGTCQVESARACDVQPARANEALPMHVWWTRAGLAMGLLDRAQEFDITAIILENDFGHVGWNKVAHGLCLYDFSDRCRLQGEHRAKVEAFREEYRRRRARSAEKSAGCWTTWTDSAGSGGPWRSSSSRTGLMGPFQMGSNPPGRRSSRRGRSSSI